MTLDRDVEILKSIPLFAKIEPSKLKLLAFTSERLRFSPGQSLFKQGDFGDAAYVILDGEVDVLVHSPQGLVRVAGLDRGEIVGEIAVLCDVPRTATVTATTPLETLKISKENFFRLIQQFPQIGLEVMNELAARLHQTTQQLSAAKSRLRELEHAR